MPALREQVRKMRERLKDVGLPAYCRCVPMLLVSEADDDPVPELCPRCGKPGARILQIIEMVTEVEQGQET